jgi:hypothetical protein
MARPLKLRDIDLYLVQRLLDYRRAGRDRLLLVDIQTPQFPASKLAHAMARAVKFGFPAYSYRGASTRETTIWYFL